MSDRLEALVDSLLYEGYALYPYTPGATKNATPTPFGIVYPPAYAERLTSTFDHLQMDCVLLGEVSGVEAEVRFLAASGERHQAEARRLVLSGDAQDFEVGELRVRLSLEREGRRVRLRVENHTPAGADMDRAEALGRSLLSTHPILRVRGGRFMSPLEPGAACENVNTWPVLATPSDDVMLGAAIVLPDHPRIAPESRGNLFDGTEIEEALLLHIQTLSDEERGEIERQDPAVRDMVARAAEATPEDIGALHGRVTLSPPKPSAAVKDPSAGEAEAEVNGVLVGKGGKVVIRPGADADLHARMLDGRTATVERIFVDLDDKVYLGVTVDDDPGQELMRETGRLLFFFAPEVEVLTP
jgi:hypothetical protein